MKIIRHDEIEQSLQTNTRQYLTGDLSLPQELNYIFDANVEMGMNHYRQDTYELPHYHTVTSEYCYILEGETKYVDLNAGKEYHFRQGDFYILRKDTRYVQKVKAGCRMIFTKFPGLNDKMPIPMNDQFKEWCMEWDNTWKEQK